MILTYSLRVPSYFFNYHLLLQNKYLFSNRSCGFFQTQQYRDNMEAVNKTLARRYRLSNRRLTIAIIAITVCVVIAVVVAVILFTNKS